MSKFIYVDNSNLYIEGVFVSAVKKRMAANIWEAHNNNTCDYSYYIDFGKLYSFLANSNPNEIKRAMLFGSRPPETDTLWNIARNAGFEVVVEDRNQWNQEKKIDTGITVELITDAFEKVSKDNDTIILVSGDSDYVPAVQKLIGKGFTVDVAFWSHASGELRNAASKFIDLTPELTKIGFHKEKK